MESVGCDRLLAATFGVLDRNDTKSEKWKLLLLSNVYVHCLPKKNFQVRKIFFNI